LELEDDIDDINDDDDDKDGDVGGSESMTFQKTAWPPLLPLEESSGAGNRTLLPLGAARGESEALGML